MRKLQNRMDVETDLKELFCFDDKHDVPVLRRKTICHSEIQKTHVSIKYADSFAAVAPSSF